MAKKKKIRVGVLGGWRGMSFGRGAAAAGLELVAVCDRKFEDGGPAWDKRRDDLRQNHPAVSLYSDFDTFLSHDMDAVILANFFHEHAPLAIKALKAGLHVMSETTAVKTLGEAVELVEAVEKSGKIYFFAENYPFMACIQEMRRLYGRNEIGEIMFAECEYMHPFSSTESSHLSPGMNHWRNWLPSTYYCTHALGPVMYVTDRRPVAVNARSIPRLASDAQNMNVRRGDAASVIVCTMDNDSVTTINGFGLRGHGNWYRFHGTRGLMENLRSHGNGGKLRIVHEPFDMKKGDVREKIYLPEFPVHAEKARRAGHGGGDFFTNFHFAQAITRHEEPWFNVYRGLDMSIVGIQAWKSALDEGRPYEVPDFRTSAARKKYRGELWSPFPEDRDLAPDQPPPSIHGMNEPSKAQIAAAKRDWKANGYNVS